MYEPGVQYRKPFSFYMSGIAVQQVLHGAHITNKLMEHNVYSSKTISLFVTLMSIFKMFFSELSTHVMTVSMCF